MVYVVAYIACNHYTKSMTTTQHTVEEIARLTTLRDRAWARGWKAGNVHTSTAAENEARDRRAALWMAQMRLAQEAIDKLTT